MGVVWRDLEMPAGEVVLELHKLSLMGDAGWNSEDGNAD